MKKKHIISSLLLASIATAAISIQAATVTVDGVTVTKLSDAVNTAQAADDGPHVINITTNQILNDGPVYITEPMTINGDANNDTIKCDILVDIPAIKSVSSPALVNGVPDKAYIIVQTSGTVEFSNLKIHPNVDGVDASGTVDEKVDGFRLLRPVIAEGIGTYNLTNVFVSGSDDTNNYISLETGNDIYSTAAKKWSGGGAGNAVVQLSGQGLGTYSATLNHCHIGLGKSAALNSPVDGTGQRRIEGGLYGHCGTDGVRISGDGFRIIGTATDRVRIVRSTNISGGNAHTLELDGGSVFLAEYVDIAGMNTANGLKLNAKSKLRKAQFIRVLGKFGDGSNSSVYVGGTSELTMNDSTIVGSGTNYNPYQTVGNVDAGSTFTDTIFTSENLGNLSMGGSSTSYSFTHCALPQDNYPAESLTLAGESGTVFTGTQALAFPAPENPVTSSPMYLLTLNDYDWSDAQGAGNPLNGAGNANVLRPSNPAYLTASSTGGPLAGGAGPVFSRIEDWMLMEDSNIRM